MHAGCAPVRRPVRPALELADIVRAHGEAYRLSHALTPEQHAVLRATAQCRTAALGGHLDVCSSCGFSSEPSYNSCLNRHCPKCQAVASAIWVAGRMKRVLPTHYFHVVFTLPAGLRPLAASNRRAVFDLLFASASATLLELGRDPKRLGAELGFTMVLHTWARDLTFHPHVHGIVTGGGLSADGTKWVAARPKFLFPVHVMGDLFRGKFLAGLKTAHAKGKLTLPASMADDPEAFDQLVDRLFRPPPPSPTPRRRGQRRRRRAGWVVYCKRPFGGPEQVLRYLGRYTHRVGISNHRLVGMDEQGVTFRTKDGKTTTLLPQPFLERFLQHVLPPGYTKIRHYGLMAAANATTKLEIARLRLSPSALAPALPANDSAQAGDAQAPAPFEAILLELTGIDARVCPACGLRTLRPQPLPEALARAPPLAA
jgi:Putative transposase/Transposase zinc-binding domain